jgi:hypothetical protein
MVICCMYTPNLERIRSKMSESLITRALAHARARTHALARVHAVCKYDKHVAHATCGYLQYVPTKLVKNPFKDERRFNYACARTRRACARCVNMKSTYPMLLVVMFSMCPANLKRIHPKISEYFNHARARTRDA